ncbi:SGS domain-containing protein [Pestalotiopsis sp. NC0098]|nr:SGS domain-containing protein [Pestalotiopsis sp. NC0098]
MSALADEGIRLIKASKYSEGIEKLSQALKERNSPLWIIERSKAYLRTNELDLALHDAELALSIAFKRGNRDLMIDAQLRRAITLFRLNRYADADVCAFWVIRLLGTFPASEDDGQQKKVNSNGDYAVTLKEVQEANQAEMQASKDAGIHNAMASDRSKATSTRNLAVTWRINALTAMEGLEAGAPGRKVSVVKYPTPSDTPPAKAAEKIVEIDDDESDKEPNKPKIPQHILTGAAPAPSDPWTWQDTWHHFQAEHKKHDVRVDWYETQTALNVSLFVKNVPKDIAKVDAKERSVTVSPIDSIPTGAFTLHLNGKIKPSETQFTVKSMKIELSLKKEQPGGWRILRDGGADAKFYEEAQFIHHASSQGLDPAQFNINSFDGDRDAWYSTLYKAVFEADSTNGAASVPASSGEAQPTQTATTSSAVPASKAKDTAPAYPTSSKSGPKNWDSMQLDDDEEKQETPDDFFKMLYKDADPDTRRAMMKSYTESNGTSLSTSWAEASKKDYKTEPPEGSVAKKWDE